MGLLALSPRVTKIQIGRKSVPEVAMNEVKEAIDILRAQGILVGTDIDDRYHRTHVLRMMGGRFELSDQDLLRLKREGKLTRAGVDQLYQAIQSEQRDSYDVKKAG
jgi:hypothetical protein